jgi:hypothetical protein
MSGPEAERDMSGPEWDPLKRELTRLVAEFAVDALNGERMFRGLPLLTEAEIAEHFPDLLLPRADLKE